MKVCMKTLACGPGMQLHPGHTYDLPEDLAGALFEGGYAEIIREPASEVETASMPGAHQTAEGAGNKRKKK